MPSALRPAVEIIARLSAERNRLRDEVARLREELRNAPRPGDLVRLQAERDALVREVAELRAKERRSSYASGARARQEDTRRDDSADAALRRLLDDRGAGSSPLAGLVGRLERAVARLEERSPTSAPERGLLAPAPSASEGRFGSGAARREQRIDEQGTSRAEAPAPRSSLRPPSGGLGGGFLGGLVQANLALRGGSGEPARSEPEGPASSGGRARSSAAARRWSEPAPDERERDGAGRAPARTRHQPAAPSGLGGGFLAGLVHQNLALRSGA